MRCTIKDVAGHAGVSTATVSRVINGGVNVSGEARTAVLSAISLLRYCPNPHAAELGRSSGRASRKHQIPKSAHGGAKYIPGPAMDKEKSQMAKRLFSLESENSQLRELVNKITKELETWRGFD